MFVRVFCFQSVFNVLTSTLLLPFLYLADMALLWVLYLAVTTLERVSDAGRLPADAVPYAKTLLYFGLAVDLIYSWTWANLVYLSPPRERLVT